MAYLSPVGQALFVLQQASFGIIEKNNGCSFIGQPLFYALTSEFKWSAIAT
ncbi:hypothetical protein HMPREF3226_02760 [Prevotella corporis]|uniref:Uncharacterized protein n=1 Tax=Prevotella corporis TaxID=28128 RepID=A0A133PTW9_9BACT|nr:hypothetical protein HMPREF3226_02760 [Prevotella corporis]